MKAGCGKTARPVCAADGGQRESNRARLLRPDSCEAGEQSEESPLRRRLRGRTQRSRWSEGRGPRGIRTSKARTGPRARLACHRRWSVYGNFAVTHPRWEPYAGKPSRWSEGRGPRGTRTSKARTGRRARSACHKRWSAYGRFRRHTPKAGAVCGNSARTDLSGGRSAMTVPTALCSEHYRF